VAPASTSKVYRLFPQTIKPLESHPPQIKMTSLFSAFNDPLFRALVQAEPESTTSRNEPFQPKFDVVETPTSYILEGELPGLDKKDVNIEFADNETLVISGKIERSSFVSPEEAEKEKKKKPKLWVSERVVGAFRRAFRFPTPVDTENAKAKFENGVLEMTLPKKGPQKKTITVE
jgi:HSP20 family protein